MMALRGPDPASAPEASSASPVGPRRVHEAWAEGESETVAAEQQEEERKRSHARRRVPDCSRRGWDAFTDPRTENLSPQHCRVAFRRGWESCLLPCEENISTLVIHQHASIKLQINKN